MTLQLRREMLAGEMLAGEMLLFFGKTGAYDDSADVWSVACTMSPEQWWKLFGPLHEKSLLANFAEDISGVPAGTANVERVFSGFGWQSSGRRCRLLAEKAHKLTTVHWNLRRKGVLEGTWWDAIPELQREQDTVEIASRLGAVAAALISVLQ
eukprot:Hpha_TRINITY_DN16756_c0_g1::TRINITY_DN16756_c0_g1_i2::g.78869::m.78869